jgi:hypothetical protein
MIAVERCPVCDGGDSTLVCRYNGLVLLRAMQDSPLARYDYACCHQCGLVYASRRPTGEEFQFLSRNFNEFLGRAESEDPNPFDNEHPLTDQDRELLRRRLKGGWLVSEEDEPPRKEWMPSLFVDRMSQGYHFDWLSASVPLEGARVLELRSKTGALLDMLRRYHHADVFAMPMFEAQQFIIEELCGIPCRTRIDFEDFDIPYEGRFDLIIAKHLFTHALHPGALFKALRERLTPGGFLYLHSENDDANMFRKGKNLFGEQKCFHFQNFNLKTFSRCLRWLGFRVVFIRHPKEGQSEMTCLAQVDQTVGAEAIDPNDLKERLSMYEQWHDASALNLPPHAQQVLGDEMESIRRRDDALRAQTGGHQPEKARKGFRIMHAEGYGALNQRARPEP